MSSSHDYKQDKRNNNIKIYINGKFFLRKNAKISVFESSNLLGDGIWDSLRYHNNNFIFLKEHLDGKSNNENVSNIYINNSL